MRTLVVAIATACLTMTSGLTVVSPASAAPDSRTCVTAGELKRVKPGTSRRQAIRTLDTRGKRLTAKKRRYPRCARPGQVIAVYAKSFAKRPNRVVRLKVRPRPRTSNQVERRVTSVAVSVRPTAASTGVPVGAALTRHNGDLVVTTPGTRVDGMDIRGFLRIKAANVSVTNTIVRGRPVDGKRGLLTSTAPGVTIRNVTLAPTTPSPYLDGLRGWGFTADRVEIRDIVDSAHVYGNDVTIRNSWLHHNRHYTNDPNQGGRPSHDDGVQILGGSRITLTGNSITGAYNAAVQITQDYDHARAIRITGNWLGYGGCTVNVAQKDRGPITGLTITNNQFDRDSRVTNCAITHDSTTNPTISSNTWTGTAKPVGLSTRAR